MAVYLELWQVHHLTAGPYLHASLKQSETIVVTLLVFQICSIRFLAGTNLDMEGTKSYEEEAMKNDGTSNRKPK